LSAPKQSGLGYRNGSQGFLEYMAIRPSVCRSDWHATRDLHSDALIMANDSADVWEVMSTARSIRRFTNRPVDDAVLDRCLEAATWAPSGANAQCWRFVLLRSAEQRAVVAEAAARALAVIEPVYGMSRPRPDDNSSRARSYRAIYDLHDHASDHTSVLFVQQRLPATDDLLLGGSIFPAVQNFLLAARAQGLGACPTSWHAYGGGASLRQAVGIPDDWVLAGHVIVGWPRGRHGRVRRHSVKDVVDVDHWNRGAKTSLDQVSARRVAVRTGQQPEDHL
jgi:nitroreductase